SAFCRLGVVTGCHWFILFFLVFPAVFDNSTGYPLGIDMLLPSCLCSENIGIQRISFYHMKRATLVLEHVKCKKALISSDVKVFDACTKITYLKEQAILQVKFK